MDGDAAVAAERLESEHLLGLEKPWRRPGKEQDPHQRSLDARPEEGATTSEPTPGIERRVSSPMR